MYLYCISNEFEFISNFMYLKLNYFLIAKYYVNDISNKYTLIQEYCMSNECEFISKILLCVFEFQFEERANMVFILFCK